MTNARPTQPNERLDVIDILRGFAIFGILVVNMLYFAQPIYLEVLDVQILPIGLSAFWPRPSFSRFFPCFLASV